MVKIYFEKYKKYLFLDRYVIKDDISSKYETAGGMFIALKRNNNWVFEGNPFTDPPLPFKFYGGDVKEIDNSIHIEKLLFEFQNGDQLSFFEVKNNNNDYKVCLNTKHIASVSCPHVFRSVFDIIIDSNDNRVIDMCLFSFMYMHNYNATTFGS